MAFRFLAKFIEKLKQNVFKKNYVLFIFMVNISVLVVLFYKIGYINQYLELTDGNIYRYTIYNILTNWKKYSFKYGIPVRMFYPDKLAALYTDPLYLEALIFAPVWLITKNIELLGTTILFFQIITQGLALFLIGITLVKLLKKYLKLSNPINLLLQTLILPLVIWGVFLPAHIRHLQLLITSFFSFSIYFILKYILTRKPQDIIYSTSFFILALTPNVYYLVYGAFLIVLLGVWMILFMRQDVWHFIKLTYSNIVRNPKNFIFPILFLFIVTIWLVINYVPFLSLAKLHHHRSLRANVLYSADLFTSYFLPQIKTSNFFKKMPHRLLHFADFSTTPEAWNFLGSIGWLFILTSIAVAPLLLETGYKRIKKMWLLLFFIWFGIFIFSSGPYLRIFGGIFYKIKMPFYYLWKVLFLFRSIRVPARISELIPPFIIMILLINFSILFKHIERNIRSKKLKILLLIFTFILMFTLSFIDTYRYETFKSKKNIYSKQMAMDLKYYIPAAKKIYSPNDVVLELPIVLYQFKEEGRYLRSLIDHKANIINGYSGFMPSYTHNLRKSLLNAAYKNDRKKLRKLICDNNIDFITIHYEHFNYIPWRSYAKSDPRMKNLKLANERLFELAPKIFKAVHKDPYHLILSTKQACSYQ